MISPEGLRSFNNLLPNCPDECRPKLIRRVDRKKIEENGLDPKIIILRVAAAYIRHERTNYNKLIPSLGKYKARMKVNKEVEDTMRMWRTRDLSWEMYKKNFRGKIIHN